MLSTCFEKCTETITKYLSRINRQNRKLRKSGIKSSEILQYIYNYETEHKRSVYDHPRGSQRFCEAKI